MSDWRVKILANGDYCHSPALPKTVQSDAGCGPPEETFHPWFFRLEPQPTAGEALYADDLCGTCLVLMTVEGEEAGRWGQRRWWDVHRRWWGERTKGLAPPAKPSKALKTAIAGESRKKPAAKCSGRK